MSTPEIQWYPGHIAKAEKALVDQLNRVDVVLEVRDARIPISTQHPKVETWVGEKPRVLVINRVDMISSEARTAWETWFRQQGEVPYFTDGQQGKGVKAIAKAAQTAGEAVNQRRQTRGMKPRPIRAVVIGFPNVGKSALINRLLNRKVVASARKAGVTRQLRWVRLSGDLDLLDAPGVIPSRMDNQAAALKLAICDDIGEASYDTQRTAAAFLDVLKTLQQAGSPDDYRDSLQSRYGLTLDDCTGEDFVVRVATQKFQDNVERTAKRILNDFRIGLLGPWVLEWPNLT
ncbi:MULTISPECIES: ribosome biogenesis GTPase YlqF [Cyanophyceae]|uniref:ribosome biogenesis GTPase YlqF n=1 Tax=Cyanophyceae TaxID=3028117 RepID=UPI001685ACD1|nr:MULTISPECIES: ribosome biogenesis GTPase YlqF [Cyanophyceae]MBD1914860.1 ribosome biogenesis GTPase YlqF [Phormidium sp. FACHB-77]MBD2031024.1 ribosome biogenesis GTPase YlqF [Phormidium sp. FACHB-322]MBD2052631.1 ribosome biogenesis GTPase YlqF [Leptolyngbya sp. FACHB-60]